MLQCSAAARVLGSCGHKRAWLRARHGCSSCPPTHQHRPPALRPLLLFPCTTLHYSSAAQHIPARCSPNTAPKPRQYPPTPRHANHSFFPLLSPCSAPAHPSPSLPFCSQVLHSSPSLPCCRCRTRASSSFLPTCPPQLLVPALPHPPPAPTLQGAPFRMRSSSPQACFLGWPAKSASIVACPLHESYALCPHATHI